MVEKRNKEEKREIKTSENYSFNDESFNFVSENSTYKNEHNNRIYEDNPNGIEDNLDKPTQELKKRKFENINKQTVRTSSAIKAVVTTASSVAVVVGGVMIYNETILPPATIEILEVMPDANNVRFLVYASNLEENDDNFYEEIDEEEECDLIIELYGGGQTLSMTMDRLGYFEGVFSDLLYETEYELSVYQNITLGFDRPLLASEKVKTGTKEEENRPVISDLKFEKYTPPQQKEIDLIVSFSVEDEFYYYSGYMFELIDDDNNVVGECVFEEGEEVLIGSLIIDDIGISIFSYRLSAISSFPSDLIDGEPERIVILESTLNLEDIEEQNDGTPVFNYIEFKKNHYIYDDFEVIVFTIDYYDPNYYWTNFVVTVQEAESVDYPDAEKFTTNLSEPYTDEQYLDVNPYYFEVPMLVTISCESTNPADINDAVGSVTIDVYSEIVRFTDLESVDVNDQRLEFNGINFFRYEYQDGSFEDYCELLYADNANCWSQFKVTIYANNTEYVTYCSEPYYDYQLLNVNGEKLSEEVSFKVEALYKDPNETGADSGDGELKVIYEEIYDFSTIYTQNMVLDSEFFGVEFARVQSGEQAGDLLGATLNYRDLSNYWSELTITISKDADVLYTESLNKENGTQQTLDGFSLSGLSGIGEVTITCLSSDPKDGAEEEAVEKTLYSGEIDFDSL